jgi:chitosanase
MLVAMGENDTSISAYAYAQNIADGRGYTNGKVGFCTGTGDAITVARCYNDAKPSNVLAKYWSGLVSINNTFFTSGTNVGATTAIDSLGTWPNSNPNAPNWTGGDWSSAATDPVFNACQDTMADAFYLSMALDHANALQLVAPLTVGFLYDTELNFGDSGGYDSTCKMTNPGTSQLLTQAQTDYQNTYGSAFPASPTAAQEQQFLGCLTFERAYAMAANCTWKGANDQNATWESARRQGNMDMSQPIVSQYHASYGSGACWSGLPSSVDSQYTTYTVETDPNNSGAAKGFQNSSQTKVACPSNPNTTCHR